MKFILNPATQVRIAEISTSLDPYLSKHCYICNKDFGIGQNVQVIEFIEHLIAEHPQNIEVEEMQKNRDWIIKKFGDPRSSQV